MNEDSAGSRRQGGRWQAAVVAVLAGTFLLAACGGGSRSSAPQVQPGPLSVQKLDAFAQCMRSHGITNFYFTRAPSRSSLVSSNLYYIKLGPWAAQVNPTSPRFQPAQQACDPVLGLPGEPPAVTAAQLRDLVRAAACMRAHGFPAFPDPDVQNGRLVQTTLPASIDVNSSQFQAAQRTCRPAM